jgi:hypothetical protein
MMQFARYIMAVSDTDAGYMLDSHTARSQASFVFLCDNAIVS